MPQVFDIDEQSSSSLVDISQFKIIEPGNIITLHSSYMHKTKVSTANPSPHKKTGTVTTYDPTL